MTDITLPRELVERTEDAIRGLLSNIMRDAPQLSGKATGHAGQAAEALRAALTQQAEPPPAPERLTEAQIEDCIDSANLEYKRHCNRRRTVRGQTVTPADDWRYWLARAVESATLAKIGAKQ